MPFVSRWTDVSVAAGARAVSTCGDVLAATVLALALQKSGAGGGAISALLLAAAFPLVVLAPITGRIADRVDSRVVLIGTGLAQAAVATVLAFAQSTVMIIALVGVLSCGLALTQPTLAALLPAMVRAADLPRASGVTQTASTTGMLLAPPLAGLLVGSFGTRVPLLLDAATYLAPVVAGLVLRTRRTAGPVAAASPVAWRLRGDRLLTVMVIAVAAVVGGVGAINVIEVFFIRADLGASTTMFGLVSGAWAAGQLVGAVVFARLARGRRPGDLIWGVLIFLAGCCVAVLGGSAVPRAALLIPLWLAGGACNGGLNVYTTVIVGLRVPAAARGRAFAVEGAAVQGAGMAGLLLGGMLVDHFDARLLVAAAGLAGLLAVLVCAPPVARAVRDKAQPGATGHPVRAGDSVGS